MLGSSITVLIVLSVAMIFLTKENVKTFSKEGYIITSGNEESSEKVYFDKGTSYKKNISSQLVFKDSSGEKVTVDTKNFMHYIDGGLKFLKNGVIMDLNSVGESAVPYYNITDKVVLEYSKKSYFIETIDKTLVFNNIAGRISEGKYIFAGIDIKLQLAGNDKLIEGDYFEVNFIKDGVIKTENQEVSYQTTAQDSYILVNDNIKIDLGNKKIYLDDEEKMSLSQMTIDGNENIEIIPDKDKDEDSDGTTDNDSGTGIDDNSGAEDGSDAGDVTGNESAGTGNNDGNNETGDGTSDKRSASVDLVKALVGVNNISASFVVNDPDNTIKGNLVLHITNTDTGKRVYSIVIDKTKPELNIGVSTLSPDSNYILSIDEEIDGEYDTQYFQKLFKTDTLGISLEKKYVTQDSIAYEVLFEKDTEVRSATITLYDEKYNEVSTSVAITPESNVVYFEELTNNTTYNIVLDNVIMDTFEYNNVYTIYKSTKTLKKNPYLEGLSTKVSDEDNKFIIGVDQVVDEDESITKYSYYIYKAEDINQDNIDTLEPVKIIDRYDSGKIDLAIDGESILPKTNYRFKLVVEYFDNEKYGEFETELSENFILSGRPTIEFVKNKEESSFNKIVGTIILNDDNCTVPISGRSCYSDMWYSNNFSLDYKVINSIEKMTIDNIKFDAKTLEASIEVDNLIANTEYVFELYGDVDLLDGIGIRKRYFIGTFRVSTDSVEILTVDKWIQNSSSKEDLINVSARIVSAGENQNLGNSIHNITFNLYAGDVEAELRAGAVKEPIKTKQVSGNISDIYFNNFFIINTLDTFGVADVTNEIIDEETGEITYENIKAIDVLKSLSNDVLLKYYTIEITDVYDEEFKNEIQIENNYFRFITPALFMMEYELEPPKITATPIENVHLKSDQSLADSLGVKYTNKLNDTTIVGYKLSAVASLDRMFNYLPIKELVYYVCDADTDIECNLEDAIQTWSIDVTTTNDLDMYVPVANGTNYSNVDKQLSRGHNYIFKLKFIIDSDGDGVVDTHYPTKEVATGNNPTPKQTPIYKNYILNTTEDTVNYKFEYYDIDNALYDDIIYYTIDDELKNNINSPEDNVIDNPKENNKEDLDVQEVKLSKCTKITDPATYITGYICDFAINSLSTDSVYNISYKRALTKKYSGIEDVKIGEYIFDGKFVYDSDTVTFSNLTSDDDNRLRIKINENSNNVNYVNRISAYHVVLSADGVEDYEKIYSSDKVSECIDESGSYKCIIVDYANIKTFKSKDITINVMAYYDTGIIDNVFATSNKNINNLLINQYGYILQNNNKFNADFKRANYIHINDNGAIVTSSSPIGIYNYSKASNSSLTLNRVIDPSTNDFATGPIEYSFNLFYANDGMYTKDSDKVNQSINNKLLSKVELSTTNNKFKFNSIIPKVKVSYKGLVNGADVTIKATGIDEEILNKEFKSENGKYYYYLDIYKDAEKTEKLNNEDIKVEVNLKDGSVISLTNYMPNTTYYFEVSAYLLKDKEYKKTLLFDANNINGYVSKLYSFSSLTPNAISSAYGVPKVAYTSNANQETDAYLYRELSLTMSAPQNIGDYVTRFELYDVNGNIVFEEVVTPDNAGDGTMRSRVVRDITPTVESIANKTDYLFGEGYYSMKIFIITDVFVNDETPEGKAELMVYESPITLERLEDPSYSVEKREEINSLTFNITITDNDRVIKDGKYCVVLLNSSQKSIAGIEPTCNLSALDLGKEITYKNLTSDTLYIFKIYSDVYTNNIGETNPSREFSRNVLVSTSTDYGVALGLVTAYGSRSSVRLSFDSGVNIKDIKKVEYTLFEQVDKETGAVAIKSETYIMGVDKTFTDDGKNVELVINPEGLSLSEGYSYSIDIGFYVYQNGQYVKINNGNNYTYGIKFR